MTSGVPRHCDRRTVCELSSVHVHGRSYTDPPWSLAGCQVGAHPKRTITTRPTNRIDPTYHDPKWLQFGACRVDDFRWVLGGIFIAPIGVGGKLRGFIEQLEAAGVPVSIVEDIAQVVEVIDADPTRVH